ncbi:uncharacterized protein LOC131333668 [Rhododendron vialii]|uniref:uncharacterized protein LOC131333668 n=1 Tax=Rhododendron vialii TaxID=182163 RepID=UPI00265F1C31|nr:uncharacterized protein LOC131333668 [Rhododendron vialii]XP_058224288.1 uncharacterized protein LOC131333668 [Rhododendron vialii]
MSIIEDFNLNSMPGYASSLKEVLKQTMLSQEVIFRKQVHELHRLHRMQKSLMEDSIWKELNGYNLWKMSTESTLGPFTNPIRYSAQPEDKSFSNSSMLESTRYASKDFLGENSDYSRLQQRSFDLQLPGDQLVNHVGMDLLQERNVWNLRKSTESNHPFDDNTVSFLEEVKLTLSFGGDTGKVGINNSTWHEKKKQSTSHHVINLEESANMASCTDSESLSTPCCAAPITKDKHNLRVPVESNHVSRKTSMKKDLSSGLTLSCSTVDSSESCEGQDSFNQGLKERNVDVAHNSIRTPLTCSKAFDLDLNIVQLDDSPYLDDSVVASSCLSMDGPSGAFDGLIGKLCENTCPAATNWGKPNVNCLNESSTILEQDIAANPTLLVPVSRNSHSEFWADCAPIKGINRTEACSIALKSMSEPTSENCEYLNCDHRNNEIGNTDSLLKFPKRNYTNVITEEVTEIREDIVLPSSCTYGSSVEDANTKKSLSSCIFDCITNDSSSGAKTMQSGTDFEGSNISLLNQYRRSQSSESGEQDLRSSDSSELKHQCCNEKKEESAAEDILIQNAAESLIHFSMKSSTSDQDCSAKAGSNGNEGEERDMPQHSIDSYESIVLKLTENSAEDYCVSSKHFEVNEMDKKDFGIKLKRGRRLKDFHRDVLPSLASLSSHEIREDVSVMQAVIRSREYKRMRSKMANIGGNLSAPVKSRRSRLTYVARRYYS